MLIKLQPDQISMFWDVIRDGMIKSYKIPDKYAQDFSIHILKQFLVGDIQCWMGYDEEGDNKVIKYFMATQIIEEKYLGLKSLYIVGFYSLIPVTKEILTGLYDAIKPYALANDCKVALADYYDVRIKGMLLDYGFEHYKSTARIYIGGN